MGKSRRENQDKKRKKESQSLSSSDNSDSSTLAVSSVLSEVNDVLYGSSTLAATPIIDTNNRENITSTPLPTAASQNQQNVSLVQSQTNDTCPPWAKELVNAFRTLESKVNGVYKKLEKLESVETKVASIGTTISNFESELSNIKSSINSSLQQTKDMITTLGERTDGVEYQCNEMDDRIAHLESENQALKWEIIDVKARSMRDNLIFSNIPERVDETPNVTENILREFLEKELKMDTADVSNIKFDRVHRMTGRNKPRAIVAKFNNFKQRQDVKFRSRELKGTNFYINEQFPPEINEQRRQLIHIAKEKQRQGHRTRLVYNKLYIDGVPYKPPTNPRIQEPMR